MLGEAQAIRTRHREFGPQYLRSLERVARLLGAT
jgi:hypothetical protein